MNENERGTFIIEGLIILMMSFGGILGAVLAHEAGHTGRMVASLAVGIVGLTLMLLTALDSYKNDRV